MFKFICTIKIKIVTLQRQTKKLTIMALTKIQATMKIFHLAKALSELSNNILGTTTTEIEMNLTDAYSGIIFYMSKYDGQIFTNRPVFESSYIKIKIFIVETNMYILDIR